MNIFRKLKASLRLREAIKQADKAHKETGERYYVMPTTGKRGQLVIMDRKNFRILKRKKYINHNAGVNELKRECFYCTPYKSGNGKLSSEIIAYKRNLYFEWVGSLKK